jgi:transposase-like protein
VVAFWTDAQTISGCHLAVELMLSGQIVYAATVNVDDAVGTADQSADEPALADQPHDETTTTRKRRRRLSPDQQREVARMYASSGLSAAAICKRFGIGESSLYRVLQKHGVALRGRAASAGDERSGVAAGASAQTRVSSDGRKRGRPTDVVFTSGRAGPASAGGAEYRFRIRFSSERVIRAQDIAEAVRRAEAFGAHEILEITREG